MTSAVHGGIRIVSRHAFGVERVGIISSISELAVV